MKRIPDRMSVLVVLIAITDRPGAALADVTAYPRWRRVLSVLPMVIALSTRWRGPC